MSDMNAVGQDPELCRHFVWAGKVGSKKYTCKGCGKVEYRA